MCFVHLIKLHKLTVTCYLVMLKRPWIYFSSPADSGLKYHELYWKPPAVQTCMFELKNVKLCQSSRLETFTPGLILFNLMGTYLINVHSEIDSVSGLLFVSLLIYVWSCDQLLKVIRLDKVRWERWYIPWTPGISSVQLLKCLCQPEQVHDLRQPFAANAV